MSFPDLFEDPDYGGMDEKDTQDTPQDPSAHGLTIDELEILDAAKHQHPGWWTGLMLAAEVMPARNKKYSGEGNTPWRNFILMARIMGKPVSQVFQYYEVIKLARIMVDSDSSEDSIPDSARDLANYALLEAGWRSMSRDEQLEHERMAGNWIYLPDDMRTMEMDEATVNLLGALVEAEIKEAEEGSE